ncbi:MAG TPA: DinB family protein [Candidatus Dormibacteraeota bacterium]|nr:DinB family protein [Candidatus Dormibacteraeota bacterium]
MSQGLTPDFILGYRAMMLDGIAREAECTKRVIAAIPDAASSYKPDPNARTAKDLAWHIANSDIQFLDGIADLKFNMDNPETKPETSAQVVAWYDENMKRGLARVAAMTPEQLLTPVAFFGVFNLPAALYLGFLNNHSIHHRGELTTYLRPMGSKVPSIYGGSYDEPFVPPAAEAA